MTIKYTRQTVERSVVSTNNPVSYSLVREDRADAARVINPRAASRPSWPSAVNKLGFKARFSTDRGNR